MADQDDLDSWEWPEENKMSGAYYVPNRIQTAEPPGDGGRTPEGPLHRHLLVQQHAYHQGQRVSVEEPVGVRVARHG